VVSLPCWELFFEQDAAYQQAVMSLEARTRVSVEAGVTTGWEKFTGLNGINIGINQFGYSAPGEVLAEKFGFLPHQVAARIREAG
jgi:transketolase